MKSAYLVGVVMAVIATGCATPPQTAQARLASDAARTAALKEHCVDSGSRIKRADDAGACSMAGRAYSKEELDSTGATSPSDALNHLDPRL